jgi:4'-phosphopantetheinyl transferase EntD
LNEQRHVFPEITELPAQLSSLAKLAHPELLIGCRAISPGDEFALFPSEVGALAGAILPVRRASGAGRIVARTLLARLGSLSTELPRTASGAPRWPVGFVGSIAHDANFAVAVVAPARSLEGVGVDIEPALPLPPELLDLVATHSEQNKLRGDLLSARLLFCIKEAVYKATHPRDGVFLEHHDVEVSLNALIALTRTGHRLQIHTVSRPRLVALATLPGVCRQSS